MKKSFNFHVPVTLSKNDKGDWRISGLASTEDIDKQGETILQNGLDITPLKEGKGLFNIDHSNEVSDIVGKIDGAYFGEKGLMVEGYLLKEVKNAQAIHQVMDSLKPEDKRSVFSLSVEGRIQERGGKNDKTIKSAVIDRVAFTTKPVNPATFVELVKSLTAHQTFKTALCDALLIKAMSVGYGQENAPATRTDGNALVPESLGGIGGKKKKKGEIPGVKNVTFDATKDLFSEHTKKSFSSEASLVDYILGTDTKDIKLDD